MHSPGGLCFDPAAQIPLPDLQSKRENDESSWSSCVSVTDVSGHVKLQVFPQRHIQCVRLSARLHKLERLCSSSSLAALIHNYISNNTSCLFIPFCSYIPNA